MNVGITTYVYKCVEARGCCPVLNSITLYLFFSILFFSTIPYWPWSSPIQLDWPASSRKPPVSTLQDQGYRHTLPCSDYFSDLYFALSVWVFWLHICIYTMCMPWVRRRWGNPWTWSYKQLWTPFECWELNPVFCTRAPVQLLLAVFVCKWKFELRFHSKCFTDWAICHSLWIS